MIGGAEPRRKQGGLHRHQPGAGGRARRGAFYNHRCTADDGSKNAQDQGEAAVAPGLRRQFCPSPTPRASVLADNRGSFHADASALHSRRSRGC